MAGITKGEELVPHGFRQWQKAADDIADAHGRGGRANRRVTVSAWAHEIVEIEIITEDAAQVARPWSPARLVNEFWTRIAPMDHGYVDLVVFECGPRRRERGPR